ncbi:MAG: hypothetical protein O2955_07090 [Planctomycetota bacterium]|nr:hypothetical protein [Planctomycetota bacterium]MDA1212262.1 hypothetical protein [Planctomycetota bacterium]
MYESHRFRPKMSMKASRRRSPYSQNRVPAVVAFFSGLMCVCSLSFLDDASAGHVRLKNSIVIEGTPALINGLNFGPKVIGDNAPSPHIMMIDNGMQRYLVPRSQVEEINQDAELSRVEEFKVPQMLGSRSKTPQTVGTFKVEPFDVNGRRTVTTSDGSLEIVQGVTLIRPDYIRVNALNYDWEFSLATTSIPHQELDAMIRQVTKQESVSDRMAIYRFYVQAKMLQQAAYEMDTIKRDFPEMQDRLDELHKTFVDFYTQQITTELRHRREAGQHHLAELAIRQFPLEELSPQALRAVGEISEQLTQGKEEIDLINARLAELQSEITDPTLQATVTVYRTVISEQLGYESLDRMSAFLNLHDDDNLSAEEKLALAYSGWVLGGAEAMTNLSNTLRLWQARFLILEFMRTENLNSRNELVKSLSELEGIGPETVAKLIPLLPPLIETPELTEDIPFWTRASRDQDEIEVRYQVLLPHEYSPQHRYPLIIALHSAGRSTDDELRWWGGTVEEPLQSRRRGYIVIAPEYVDSGSKSYDYSPVEHFKVLESLKDARKRFRIDSDRVFLSGHGMGGDAAFDIGMSHAYEFAGIIPISGVCEKFCTYYWENAKRLPWYIVAGERDRDLSVRNAKNFDRMMKYRFDMIYTEYTGRGYETFYSEIHRLFDWMEVERRAPSTKSVEHKLIRYTDSRSDWIMTTGIRRQLLPQTVVWTDGKPNARPVSFTAEILDGAADRTIITIKSPGDNVTLWLSPQLIDYNKRLHVRIKNKIQYNDFPQPNIGHMLDDLRLHGDRERVCWTKLDF